MTINPPPTRVPSKLQPDSESTSFMRDFTTSVYQLWATVTSTTGVFSGITDLTGDVTASGPGVASATLAVANSDVGTWGSGSLIPVITVNAKGLITAVSTATFAVVPSDISGFDAAARAAVVTDAIVDGVTDYAPSQNAVYDALALKLNTSATTTDVAEGTRLYYTDERVDDRVAALIQNGTGITWSYNDGSNTLTPTVTITQYTDEMAQDAIATLIQNGTGITWSYNDVSNTLTPTVTITQYTDALAKAAAVADAINNGTTDVAPSQNAVFDALALKFDQSNFIDEDSFASNSDTKAPSQQSVKAYVDAAIIGGGGYTDEQAQDAVGAMVDSTLVYVDGTPSLGRAAISGDITISSGSNTAAIGTGVIVNADVNGSAAIALSKLAATTASRALVSDASGFVTAATTTATEIGYVNGVTSSIQTQINGKQASDATLTALAGLATGANKIPYSTGTDTFGQLDFVDEDNMASNSATAIPSQQSVKAYVDASSGGAVTLLGTATANNTSANLDFTSLITSAYDAYFFLIEDLIPATDSVYIAMRTSTDNGSTFDSGASNYAYSWAGHRIGTTGILSSDDSGNSTVATEIIMCGTGIGSANCDIGNGAAEGISGIVWLYYPQTTIRRSLIKFELMGNSSSAGAAWYGRGNGVRAANADIDAVRFKTETGNWSSGRIRMYGVKNT